jgi:hypothetical protein
LVGWTRVRLAHFLTSAWDALVAVEDEIARRAIFESAGARLTLSPQRSIIEAVIARELTDQELASYITGDDTPKVQAILTGYCPSVYGGKKYIPTALRARVYARDARRCLACGSTAQLSCDHYPVPESEGGETVYENLRTLCRSCNCTSGVKALSIDELRRRRGLI